MSRSLGTRRAALMVYWAWIFFMTHWPKVDDFPGIRWFPVGSDKLAHFGFFAGWAVGWCWVLHGRGATLSGRMAGWLMAGGATYAVMDELTQAIVSREPDLGDFIADMSGIVVALLAAGWYFRRRARGWQGRQRGQVIPGTGAR